MRYVSLGKRPGRDRYDPGGTYIVERGCTCSVEKNNGGLGVPSDRGLRFYPDAKCPWHGLEAIGRQWELQGRVLKTTH
jgi:hypothetical protein